jgi:hypothetical protein
MKKFIILIFSCTALIFIIFSCKKSFDSEPNTSNVNSSNHEVELKIQVFQNRLESNLKDGKTYSIDSAIWYSTALLNYTYAIYDSALLHISCDTSTFSLALDENGRVEESDLETAIDQMIDSLEAQYDGLQESTKHLVYCMMYETATYEGRLDVGMVAVIGFGYNPIFYDQFEEDDYWYAILDYGKCDEYEPAYYDEQDAGEEIEYKIMHPLVVYNPIYRIYTVPGSEEFFEDINPGDFPFENSPSGYRGYYHTEQGNWPGPECLDPDHLNFYLTSNGIDYIIDYYQPQGLDFIWIDIDGELLFLQQGWYEEIHLIDLLFAETYQTLVPAGSL